MADVCLRQLFNYDDKTITVDLYQYGEECQIEKVDRKITVSKWLREASWREKTCAGKSRAKKILTCQPFGDN